MFEVIAFNTDYPDEDSFPIFSGSEEECENFFSHHDTKNCRRIFGAVIGSEPD